MEKGNYENEKRANPSPSTGGQPSIDDWIVPVVGYVVYRECGPKWLIPKRPFPYWDVTYVVKGTAEYIIDGKKHELVAGDLLCKPKGIFRSATSNPDNPMHCYAINFLLQDLQGRDATLPFPLVSHIGYQKDIINLYEEMVAIWDEKRPGYLIRTRALFSLILCRFFELISADTEPASTGDARIRRITHYIASHYGEKFTVKQLAAQTGLNTAYFGSLFKQNTGVTFNQYVIRTRVRAAMEMLKSGNQKVSEVADLCGYSDVFHFYKQFKKIIGIKPSQFLPKKNG